MWQFIHNYHPCFEIYFPFFSVWGGGGPYCTFLSLLVTHLPMSKIIQKYHLPFGIFPPFLSVLGSQVLPRSLMTSQYLPPSLLGKYSFPLYCCVCRYELWHTIWKIIHKYHPFFPSSSFLCVFIFGLLAMAFATLVYHPLGYFGDTLCWCFVGLAYQGKDIVFRFIIDYNS
jgi:hypothetical protein